MSAALVEITDPDRDKYATLRLISWWDQERLRNSRVLVVGAGALGNEVLKNLALLGVGRLIVVDMDRVEVSNLSRAILFRKADAGRSKAVVSAAAIRALNGDVRMDVLDGDVCRDVGLGLFRRVDLVLGCLDNREARLALNRACSRTGAPWIDGAIDVLMGSVRTFSPPGSSCYECVMTEEDFEIMNIRYSCPKLRPEDVVKGRLPTTPTSAAIIAGMMVQEATKLLHGLDVQVGTSLYYNGHTYELTRLHIPKREDCGSHEPPVGLISLNARAADLTLGQLLRIGERYAEEPVCFLADRDIVLGFECRRCGRRELVYRPYEAVVPGDVRCPACGSARIPGVTTRLAAPPQGHDVALARLGVPPLHIVRLEGISGRHWQFELSGDEPIVCPGLGVIRGGTP